MLSWITGFLFDWLNACFIVCQWFGVFFQVVWWIQEESTVTEVVVPEPRASIRFRLPTQLLPSKPNADETRPINTHPVLLLPQRSRRLSKTQYRRKT
jgi:hypothetical protein